jgi:hypothetical protein
MAERIHPNAQDVILQAAVFEIVTEEVGKIPVPAWVCSEFGERDFAELRLLEAAGQHRLSGRVGHLFRTQAETKCCKLRTFRLFVANLSSPGRSGYLRSAAYTAAGSNTRAKSMEMQAPMAAASRLAPGALLLPASHLAPGSYPAGS